MRIPLLFGEDFLIQLAGNRVRYVVEGSNLAKALKYK